MNLEPKDNMPYYFIGDQATYMDNGRECTMRLENQRVYNLTLVQGKYLFQTGQYHTWFSVSDSELFIEDTAENRQGWAAYLRAVEEQRELLQRMDDLKITFTTLRGIE